MRAADSPEGRSLLGLGPEDPVCDAAFVLFDEDPIRIGLVELKGVDVTQALRQITSTHQAAEAWVASRCRGVRPAWTGRILCSASPPQRQWQRLAKQARLDVRCRTGRRLDPRDR